MSGARSSTDAIEELAAAGPFDYDADLFLTAVDEALDRWRENENYAERLERVGAPDRITEFADLYELPAVDMREFKKHADELVIDPTTTEEELTLFSSGTTGANQSYAPRSPPGYDDQRRLFNRFAEATLPDVERAFVLVPGPDGLDRLSRQRRNRAYFTYVRWLFEPFDPEYFVRVKRDGGLVPDFGRLADALESVEEPCVTFGAPPRIEGLCEHLDRTDRSVSLPDGSVVATGGGWKGAESTDAESFRERITDQFGIPWTHHVDYYGATEFRFFTGNVAGDPTPDEKRITAQGFVYLADERHLRETGEVRPAPDGEPGLLVGIDPTNVDHPGVVLTDDVVRKTGPVYGEDTRIEYVGRSAPTE